MEERSGPIGGHGFVSGGARNSSGGIDTAGAGTRTSGVLSGGASNSSTMLSGGTATASGGTSTAFTLASGGVSGAGFNGTGGLGAGGINGGGTDFGGTTSTGGFANTFAGTTGTLAGTGGLGLGGASASSSVSSGGSSAAGGTFSSGGNTNAGGSVSSGGASVQSGGTAGTSSSGGSSNTIGGCDWAAGPPAFGPALSLGAPNTARSEIDPVVTRDGLRLYFVSYASSATGNDIYLATRPTTSANFGAGTLVTQASTSSNDTHAFESPNGLELFESSNQLGTIGAADIFRATRASPTDTWGSFASLPNVNSTGGDFDPHLESDGLTLWFDPIGRSDGLGLQDIFFARRADLASNFGAPVLAPNINSTANDWNVSLSDDGRVIVFQSDRGTSPHVYYALRPDRNSSFTAPLVLTALDQYMTTLSDPFVSPDGCAIYFSAQIAGGAGLADLYVIKAN